MSGAEDARSSAPVLVESLQGFDILTLNRPTHRNALDAPTVESLHEYLDECASKPPNALLIRAAGPGFCAGFDLEGLDDSTDAELLHRFIRIELLLQRIFHAPFPVAAFAHGHAVGAGADLFCACAMRWASADVRFRFPGWAFGLALGTRRLAQVIGSQATRAALLESRQLDASKALELGLVHRCMTTGEEIEAMRYTVESMAHLSAPARSGILDLTHQDTREADLAALVRSAAQPGLRNRIARYRDAVRNRGRRQ